MQSHHGQFSATSQAFSRACVYYRAVIVAQFSALENRLVCLYLESADPGGISVNQSALARRWGNDRSNINIALARLRAGRVVLPTQDGRWRLNPCWQEWRDGHGLPRIDSLLYQFVVKGVMPV